MLKSILCGYSGSYILVSGTITIEGAGADNNAKWLDGRRKGVIFKNCALFTDCINKINNTQIDNAKDLDVAIPTYNLIEHSNNYLKKSESLRQYQRDDSNDNIIHSESWHLKTL